MARYYYTDPLKVEWMRREFGFKFMMGANPFADDFNFVYLNLETSLMYGLEYNVAPDSYEMLKPQDGDIGSDGNYPARFEQDAWRSDEYIDLGMEGYAIIQRDGKAWFTPEVEGD